jgi:Acetoacetate decarboxylase (ADC)
VLTGTADVDRLASRAATMPSFEAHPVTFPAVEVVQAVFEMRWAARQVTLPPGLHPTNPPILTVLAWRAPESPWGPFSLAQLRVGCRSGVRPRGLVAGCVNDNPAAAAALAAGWGLPGRIGTVGLQRRYDAVSLEVLVDGRQVLALVGRQPVPLQPGDVQYTVTMTLASTPRGVRLVQVEPEYRLARVERLRARLTAFDGAGWGEEALAPSTPVSATVGVGDVTLPRLRFVSRPDVSAFQGTESVP